MLLALLIALFVIGAAIGIYALVAPKREGAAVASIPAQALEPPQPAAAAVDWTHQAGEEFAGLSESARCDMIFAMSALDDDRSRHLLYAALDDPSATVALAAAHTLARNGRIDELRSYAQTHSGPRATELLQLVSLLT